MDGRQQCGAGASESDSLEMTDIGNDKVDF